MIVNMTFTPLCGWKVQVEYPLFFIGLICGVVMVPQTDATGAKRYHIFYEWSNRSWFVVSDIIRYDPLDQNMLIE